MTSPADEDPLHPLIEAIQQGDVTVVAELLNAHADPNVSGTGVPALGGGPYKCRATARLARDLGLKWPPG